MENTIKFLHNLGINNPNSDFVSSKTFKDNGQYRLEVPGIQNSKSMSTLLEEANKKDIILHRITQTKGIMLLTDNEIEEMVNLARKYEVELFLSTGPRATYDTSASVHTPEGSRMGYRLRGFDNLVYAIEDVKRAVTFGVRGILIYDEGLLFVLNEMRKSGDIPKNTKFKLSAHTGHGNPASVKLFEKLGLNSLNPVRDLQIPMIATIRDSSDIPLDLHTENPKSSGGFIRHYEVPEMIRVASPVYLKTGGSIAKTHNWETSKSDAVARLRQVELIYEMINRYCPRAIPSPKASKDLAIPEDTNEY